MVEFDEVRDQVRDEVRDQVRDEVLGKGAFRIGN
jgi:hypothetical protein